MVLKANLKYHNILYVVEEKKYINICGKSIYKNILKILKKHILYFN
jgi:hypothetical protein